jgi:tetratricopeptide (TPR) repeat protein
MGYFSLIECRLDDSIANYKVAHQRDPLNVSYYKDGGLNYHYAGRLKEAELSFKKALELDPEFPRAHSWLGRVYLAQNRPELALTEMQQETHPAFRQYGLALAYSQLGREQEAAVAIKKMIEDYGQGAAFQIAEVYAFRNEPDSAMQWLEEAYRQRDAIQ